MQEQGCKIVENTVYRDNTNAMKMEINGKTSSIKKCVGYYLKLVLSIRYS
jgi:hypothetical protein